MTRHVPFKIRLIGLMTATCLVEVCVSIGDVNCSTMCARSVATVQHEPDAASAATCWTQKVEDTYPGPAHENGDVVDSEVASHPLSANLSQEICGENPKLATQASEVIGVAKEAVAVPGELLGEALQALRRVGSRSTAAGAPKRRCDSRGRLWWKIWRSRG